MLLFILSFYLNYDSFNCNENKMNVKFNESLIVNKYYQNLLQVNDVLKDVQQNIHDKSVLIAGEDKHGTIRDEKFYNSDWLRSETPGTDQTPKNYKYLPAESHSYPQYDPSANITNRRQGLYGLPRFFPLSDAPLSSPVLSRPKSSKPKAFFSFKNYVPYLGLSDPRHQLIPVQAALHPDLSSRFLSGSDSYISSNPPDPLHAPSSTKPAPARPLFLIINYFLQKKSLYLNPPHPTISLFISKPEPISTTSRPENSISSTLGTTGDQNTPYTLIRKKVRKVPKGRSPTQRSERTTVPVIQKRTKDNVYPYLTRTANTAQLFHEDEQGFLYVTLPKMDMKPAEMAFNPTSNWMSTFAGDVLHGKIKVQTTTPSPKQRYFDLMDKLDEGYMMVFITELCRLIAVKNKQDVRNVLSHTEIILTNMWQNGRLTWVHDPLQTVAWKISLLVSQADIDMIRTYSSMMYHMLLQRKQELSAEVNTIIDEADLLYEDHEGERLFDALKEFEDYPQTSKTSYWVCDTLIETFLLPFRRLSGSNRRQIILDSINKVLMEKFPHILRELDKETDAGKEKPHKRRRQKKRHQKPVYKVLIN